MRLPVRSLLVAGVLTAGLVVAGVVVLGDDDPGPGTRDAPAPKAPFATTPLADVDTVGLTFARGPFCDDLDPRLLEATLGGEPTASRAWQNGDAVSVADGKQDVGHEFGCEYTGADGAVARAWVFAPPVDAEWAGQLVKAAGRADGCEPGDGPALGEPTVSVTCTAGDGTVRASYRGLLGDAWLVCEVVLPVPDPQLPPDPRADDLTDRAGRWCAGVLVRTGSGEGQS